MPRRPDPIPKIQLKISLPVPLRAQLDLALISQFEGRVPLGDYSRYFTRLLEQDLSFRTLDLSTLGCPPGTFVRGPQHCIDKLRTILEATQKGTSK
jgi:hypothetical protein